MPTLNPYANDPGYYIRAWTSDLGNINYKLKPQGWNIINDWGELTNGGEITWQQINALKSVGVVFTEDTGVIYPDDEKFQPDPEQLDSMDLSDEEASAFLDAILTHCDLSAEQIADLCQMLGIDPPTDGPKSRFSDATDAVESELADAVSAGTFPITETLPLSTSERMFETGPNYDKEYHHKAEVITFAIDAAEAEQSDVDYAGEDGEDSLGIVFVKSSSDDTESRDFVLHQIFVDTENITTWSVRTSQELTWEIRSELFSQIGTLLQLVVDAFDDTDTEVSSDPTNFDIDFGKADVMLTPN